MSDFGELRALSLDLAAATGRVGALASAAIRKTALDIQADAQALAPVDTGNLRSSIGTDIAGDGRFGVIEAEIGPTADYGAYVEYGTSRMAPQPYLGPAFDRRAPGLEQALGRAVEDLL